MENALFEHRNLGCPAMFAYINHEVVVASTGKRSIQLFVQSFTKSVVTVTDNNYIVVQGRFTEANLRNVGNLISFYFETFVSIIYKNRTAFSI